MSYTQNIGDAPTQARNNQFGYNYTAMHFADPDIAAQGAQNRQTLQQQNEYKTGLINRLLPYANTSMTGGGGLASGQIAAQPSFRSNLGPAPTIKGGPIWSQQAINQNVNANNARVDQGTASNQMTQAGQLAGQGFGARSPLTRALEQMGNQSAMGQKADYQRQFEQQAREQNANFGLQSQQAQANQYNQLQQADIGYGNLENQAYGTLQNALNQQLAAQQSGLNAQTQMRGSLVNALLNLAG